CWSRARCRWPDPCLGLAVAAILSRHHLAVLGVPARFARWSWAASAAVVLSYATCSVLVGMDFGGIWPGAWGGLFERLAAYTGLCWVSLTGHALSRAYRPTRTNLGFRRTNLATP